MNEIDCGLDLKGSSIGQVLQDKLESKGMTQSELCEMTEIAKPVLNDVIKGRRNLTAEMAVLIESALGISADNLMRIQSYLELEKAYNNKDVMLIVQKMSEWDIMSKHISIPTLKKLHLFQNSTAKNVDSVLKLCHVNNIEEFNKIAKQEESQTYYKKSEKLNIDNAALFIWKYYCIDKAQHTKINRNFRKDSIMSIVKELIPIFTENYDTYNRVQSCLFKYGIRMLYINKVGQVPVDGMSFWTDSNPTIIITQRLQNIDNFAFSIMHELGHIKYHLKPNDQPYINLDGKAIDSCEEEANSFALEVFFPKIEWEVFMNKIKDYNPFTVHIPIKSEAEKRGINPQILYGRYIHDTGLYRLRRVFDTEIH